MLFNNQEEINQSLQGIVNWDNDDLIIKERKTADKYS
ncbi:MAG: hypothetical protein Ct9H300mP23_07960 [Nitrospinota bacterium]|nr:MAG: hypothetical protein Ct9H300mP23_07960 [Nitrospinota bacterium]